MGTPGCAHQQAFSPQSREDLQTAFKECSHAVAGDCSGGPHGSIGDWDVSAVTNMRVMFAYLPSFNQDLSKWDVSRVTSMESMFSDARTFNQDLSKWDVSRVIVMASMFSGASAFNQDLSQWDVSAVTDMGYMFSGAFDFNQDLSNWDVATVTVMWYMFSGASAFNQYLSTWTSQPSMTWFPCSMVPRPSSANCVALPGWTPKQTKPTCLQALQALSHIIDGVQQSDTVIIKYSRRTPKWISEMLLWNV